MKLDLYSIINSVRTLASEAIEKSFTESRMSEHDVKENIKKNLFSNSSLLAEGWYSPPPYGVGVLCAERQKNERLKYSSLRNPEYWAQKDIFFGDDSLALLYASPVDRLTGIIGDTTLTVYNGKDVALQEHLKNGLTAIEEIVEGVRVGQSFKEIFNDAETIIKSHGLYFTRVIASTGAQMANIGHTIPWSYEDMNAGEKEIFAKGPAEKVNDMISKKRKFVNAEETFVVPETCAFTIESKMQSDDLTLPSVYFHIIVVFQNGQKKVCSNFNPIFRRFGMDSYLQCKFG